MVFTVFNNGFNNDSKSKNEIGDMVATAPDGCWVNLFSFQLEHIEINIPALHYLH
jgi:hypothetical protein